MANRNNNEDGERTRLRDGISERKNLPPPDNEVRLTKRRRPPDDEARRRAAAKHRQAEGSKNRKGSDKRQRNGKGQLKIVTNENGRIKESYYYGGDDHRRRKRRPPDDEYVRKRRQANMSDKKYTSKKQNIRRDEDEEEENKNSRGCLFPVFLILSCIAVFLISFTVFLSFMHEHTLTDLIGILKGEGVTEKTESSTESSADSGYIDTNDLFKEAEELIYNTEREGIVSQISIGSNTVRIYDTKKEESVQLNFDSDTVFTDENGVKLTANKIKEGDAVLFMYNEDKKLVSLSLDPDIGEYTSLDVSINTSRKLVKIGNETFRYKKDTVFRYKDKEISPEDITEFDIITVKTIDNIAWSVVMEKSHGSLRFTNHENISSVTYSVDGSEFKDIPNDSVIYLPEGLHTIMVKSPNCTSFSGEAIIKQGEEAEMSLASVQVLRGSLIVDTTATGAVLYVDGIQRSFGNPVFLDYGDHKITAERQGKTSTKYVNINKEQTYIDVYF